MTGSSVIGKKPHLTTLLDLAQNRIMQWQTQLPSSLLVLHLQLYLVHLKLINKFGHFGF